MPILLRRRAQLRCGFPPGAGPGLIGGASIVVEAGVVGTIDPITGMVINIRDIDAAMKRGFVAKLDGTTVTPADLGDIDRDLSPEWLCQCAFAQIGSELGTNVELAYIELRINEKLVCRSHTERSAHHMVGITRIYDFSASHRLHSNALSDAQNQQVFGKCNWENGHGHNYYVEVTLASDSNDVSVAGVDLAALDKLVNEAVIVPMDHRHLNFDVAEFSELNPTSENLTLVIWRRLEGPILSHFGNTARLYRVVVKETERNYFEYYGD